MIVNASHIMHSQNVQKKLVIEHKKNASRVILLYSTLSFSIAKSKCFGDWFTSVLAHKYCCATILIRTLGLYCFNLKQNIFAIAHR